MWSLPVAPDERELWLLAEAERLSTFDQDEAMLAEMYLLQGGYPAYLLGIQERRLIKSLLGLAFNERKYKQ